MPRQPNDESAARCCILDPEPGSAMTIDKSTLLKAGVYATTFALPATVRGRVRLRWRTRIELAQCRGADLVVLSRAKSGRTWLRAMLSTLYQRRYGLDDGLLLDGGNFHRIDRRIPNVAFFHGHSLDAVFGTTDALPWDSEKPVIFLVRHPCDVAVSEYFQSTRRASAHKREMHGVDAALPMFAFVMNGTAGLRAIVAYMNAWRERVSHMPNALTVRYEDMRAAPERELARIVRHIGEPFTADEIATAVAQCAYDVMKEKERSNHYGDRRLAPRDLDDPDSYKVRRGKVGGYRDYFTPAEIAAMEEYVCAHLAPAFGYEALPIAVVGAPVPRPGGAP
jgi:hypothetical protein